MRKQNVCVGFVLRSCFIRGILTVETEGKNTRK